MNEPRWDKLRAEFTVLAQPMNGKRLAYLDNAATSQKPRRVLERMQKFYSEEYAAVHRGVYTLGEKATESMEATRDICQKFLDAGAREEIIFVRGATEAINLVATAYGRPRLKPGDEILITEVEHHANWVPWQMLAQATGATFRVAPVEDTGDLDLGKLKRLVTGQTKIVAITHASNVTGAIFPVKEIAKLAHEVGAVILVDGAQAVPHGKVSVRDLDCDFYCFSGHKIYGPTGIGILYGKKSLLESMTPYQFGGEMIKVVSEKETTFAHTPHKFEAGTPAVAEIVGLGEALRFLDEIGRDAIAAREAHLLEYALKALPEIPDIRFIGNPAKRTSLVSFLVDDIHPHDIGTVLSEEGVAIRAGHHCAQPAMKRFGVTATARASFSFYNNEEDIQALVRGLQRVRKVFAAA